MSTTTDVTVHRAAAGTWWTLGAIDEEAKTLSLCQDKGQIHPVTGAVMEVPFMDAPTMNDIRVAQERRGTTIECFVAEGSLVMTGYRMNKH